MNYTSVRTDILQDQKEGMSIVKRELKVDTLTPENIQSLWPYITKAPEPPEKIQIEDEEFYYEFIELNKYNPGDFISDPEEIRKVSEARRVMSDFKTKLYKLGHLK